MQKEKKEIREPMSRLINDNWKTTYIPTEKLIGVERKKQCKKCKQLCSEFVPSVGICVECHRKLKYQNRGKLPLKTP